MVELQENNRNDMRNVILAETEDIGNNMYVFRGKKIYAPNINVAVDRFFHEYSLKDFKGKKKK